MICGYLQSKAPKKIANSILKSIKTDNFKKA